MKFIGDIHGDWKWYNNIMSTITDTIQVGDFGCGFEEYASADLDIDLMVRNNHQVFRGNHDDPEKIKRLPTYIFDGTFDNTGEVFCIGGAESIDKNMRIENVSWWKDEQVSTERYYQIMDYYEKVQPDIVATHDCPTDVYNVIYGIQTKPSATAQALSSILYIHRPKVWVFGHHHINFDKVIDGVRFVCCPINTVIEI